MKLYVMRHGPAEDQSDSGLDGDRVLTASGRERVRAVAKLLTEAGEAPLAVVTSPLVRAVQTAEIVATGTQLRQGNGSVEVSREMSPSGDALALVDRLVAEGRKRAMVVGHEPDLSELVTSLLGKTSFRRGFDKAMVVGLRVSVPSAEPSPPAASPGDGRLVRLRFVLDPKALRFDPDERTKA
jgi:phosphohistidine phosphatase